MTSQLHQEQVRRQTIRLELKGRPYSLKNSRRTITRGKRTMNVRNEKAESWLTEARWQLRRQHPWAPFAGCFRITICVYYADRRWWLDQSAVAESVFDALKGIVVEDDSPEYLAETTIRAPKLSREGRAHVEIELEEVLT